MPARVATNTESSSCLNLDNRRLRVAAAEASVQWAEVAPLAYRGRKTYASDYFHPNDSGYEAWLIAFAAALEG